HISRYSSFKCARQNRSNNAATASCFSRILAGTAGPDLDEGIGFILLFGGADDSNNLPPTRPFPNGQTSPRPNRVCIDMTSQARAMTLRFRGTGSQPVRAARERRVPVVREHCKRV